MNVRDGSEGFAPGHSAASGLLRRESRGAEGAGNTFYCTHAHSRNGSMTRPEALGDGSETRCLVFLDMREKKQVTDGHDWHGLAGKGRNESGNGRRLW